MTSDPIIPDTKDWTWVVEAPCAACGYDSATVAREQVAPMIRANADAWADILARGEVVRQRPRPGMWSPLEYGCHVRDVFRIYDYRLGLILDHDDPTYPNWDQDETAVTDRYGEQDPAVVARELRAAADQLATRFDAVHDDQWSRTGNRSDGARFTVDTFARYLVHDVVHHVVADVASELGDDAHGFARAQASGDVAIKPRATGRDEPGRD